MFRNIYIFQLLVILVFVNCKFFQEKESSKDPVTENKYLKIQDSYTSIQSDSKGQFVVIDFLLNWKMSEKVDLSIRDNESGIVLYENSVQAVPFLKLRSLPIHIQLSQYKWFYENPNENSIRIFQFQITTLTKEQLVLDYGFNISKETKHSLIQKFTLR